MSEEITKLISAQEAADLLGVRVQTVYGWARDNRLPFYRVGRLIKFHPHELMQAFRVETDTKAKAENKIVFELQPLKELFHSMPSKKDKEESQRLERYRNLLRVVK